MGRKIEKALVFPKRYYIVDYKNLSKPRYFNKGFRKYEDAFDAMVSYLGLNPLRYEITLGIFLLEERLIRHVRKPHFLKYNYPPHIISEEQRREYRRNFRNQRGLKMSYKLSSGDI